MDLYEWLLFLHVAAAFLLVAGLAAFGALLLDGGAVVRGVLAKPAGALWNVGGLSVLVLGIWLALKEYEIWDAWIIAAIVLWLIASGAGGQFEKALREGREATGLRRHYVVMSLAALALLIDMIWKPGA
jgi:hypothetical protein